MSCKPNQFDFEIPTHTPIKYAQNHNRPILEKQSRIRGGDTQKTSKRSNSFHQINPHEVNGFSGSFRGPFEYMQNGRGKQRYIRIKEQIGDKFYEKVIIEKDKNPRKFSNPLCRIQHPIKSIVSKEKKKKNNGGISLRSSQEIQKKEALQMDDYGMKNRRKMEKNYQTQFQKQFSKKGHSYFDLENQIKENRIQFDNLKQIYKEQEKLMQSVTIENIKMKSLLAEKDEKLRKVEEGLERKRKESGFENNRKFQTVVKQNEELKEKLMISELKFQELQMQYNKVKQINQSKDQMMGKLSLEKQKIIQRQSDHQSTIKKYQKIIKEKNQELVQILREKSQYIFKNSQLCEDIKHESLQIKLMKEIEYKHNWLDQIIYALNIVIDEKEISHEEKFRKLLKKIRNQPLRMELEKKRDRIKELEFLNDQLNRDLMLMNVKYLNGRFRNVQ